MRRTTLLALLAAVAVAGWIALFERDENASDDGQPVFGLDQAEILAVEIERPGEPTVRLTRVDEGFVVAAGEGPESFADSGEVDFLLQNVGSLRFERELEGIREEDLPSSASLHPDSRSGCSQQEMRRTPNRSPPVSAMRLRHPETGISVSATGSS